MPRDPEGHDYVQNGGQIEGVRRLGGEGPERTGQWKNMNLLTHLRLVLLCDTSVLLPLH